MRAYNLGCRRASCILGILAVCLAAGAIPPTKAVEEVRALERSGDPELETSLSAVVGDALRAFDIPVSWEMHPEYGRSTASTVAELPFAVKHSVKKNQTLAHCLDELVVLSRGLLEVQSILGNTCIVPKKSDKDEILTNLDVQVSLHLEKVSTWEALKALAIEINTADATEYGFFVTLECLNRGNSPPAAFTDERVISLSLDKVTARYALCAIMSASPLELSYTLVCSTKTDNLVISVYEDGKRALGNAPPTPAQWEWWRREKSEVGWERDR